jgi:Rha family phage regulatory protein
LSETGGNAVSKKPSKEIMIVDKGGEQLWTTSLDLAEKFGKNHDKICRDIKNLNCSAGFNVANFGEIFYTDSRGRQQSAYEMTRDGFTLLAMGFTGKKAITWKEKYIAAFNAMEKKILRDARSVARQGKIEFQQARLEGKVERRELTDAIQRLKELADEQNPDNNAERYYTTFTKMVVSILFNLKRDIKGLRDEIPASALRRLQMVEGVVADWLNAEVARKPDYHEPYGIIKERTRSLVNMIGQYDLSLPT